MIIKALLEVIFSVLSVLTSGIGIPMLPEEIWEPVLTALEYLSSGASILAIFTPFSYLATLFGIILAVDVGLHIYHFVMWVLKKIPMISVS